MRSIERPELRCLAALMLAVALSAHSAERWQAELPPPEAVPAAGEVMVALEDGGFFVKQQAGNGMPLWLSRFDASGALVEGPARTFVSRGTPVVRADGSVVESNIRWDEVHPSHPAIGCDIPGSLFGRPLTRLFPEFGLNSR